MRVRARRGQRGACEPEGAATRPTCTLPTHGRGMSPRAADCPDSHTDACHTHTPVGHMSPLPCVPAAHPLVQLSSPKARLEQQVLLPTFSPVLPGSRAPGPAPYQSWDTSAGAETALSPPRPWGRPHHSQRPYRVAAPTDPPFSLLCPQCWSRGAGLASGWDQCRAHPAAACSELRGTAWSGAQSLSAVGNTTQAKSVSIQFTSGKNREAAERPGSGSRTFGLPTQLVTNSKGSF